MIDKPDFWLQMPPLEFEALWPHLSAQEQEDVLHHLREKAGFQNSTLDWLPFPGPQAQAYYSPADELLYGGAAGGG